MALYDPQEFPEAPRIVEVAPSPDFTVADVLAFVRSKPADEAYVYTDLDNCALAQFVLQAGFDLHGEERHALERGEIGTASSRSPLTFGALASRLEALS
jgi:hypothetical protein